MILAQRKAEKTTVYMSVVHVCVLDINKCLPEGIEFLTRKIS